jgi:undecaprenyl diphosphate synthase
MDGNGRWARTRGLPRQQGHRAGADSVREIVRACRRRGIEALTLYAFSEQNWARPEAEVKALMALLARYVVQERRELLSRGIRLRAIGDLSRLPPLVARGLQSLVEASANNKGMQLCLALSYGGREELLRAAKRLASACQRGELSAERIDATQLEQALYTSELPPLDLLIRTGGEKRLSNFLLWQAAYAELHFSDAMWPDFREDELLEAFFVYGQRQRRYGRTPEQVAISESA